ncbi:orotidine-5'-phosphate decarboxylase [Corynebacterium sp. ES2794-CONJ1]|nr:MULTISPECIES: orotidine-5'-phosphate decarboxylase [unclassified Corynebacterium]MCS4489268.1 orotidine-5'-phosphate decarboxylase [Corynebacterium sp. ES2775-CONJ]MCS4491081.1 orotidine-5'-phosphate decarboxylase [Corynebacterium sp. ES2715-CONJ3]MCS4531038.1 orotidine-5'-phosphate decarboxylase [Corynebacterium sp. ES2730-CONJ]MCU9518405.1 orotidine-5'-phosphate decarboxylase [Corynebacterium sp. ES2794-CONJ1]
MEQGAGFGYRLREAGRRWGRLCVGIDPHPELLSAWSLEYSPSGIEKFSEICVEAFAGHVALIKPQVAFYEAFGAAGISVLETVLSELRQAGTLVLADAKRGDIGSTMAGYARAWLDPSSPLGTDSVTVSPYLGFGSLQPVIELAHHHKGGLFVLAATSNPEARHLQNHCDAHGVRVSQQIVNAAASVNNQHHTHSVGDIGVVIGATVDNPPDLSEFNGPVLLPGVGAQGAQASDVARITKGVTDLSFPNISRAILRYGPSASKLRDEARKCAEEFS